MGFRLTMDDGRWTMRSGGQSAVGWGLGVGVGGWVLGAGTWL
ncbi:MAG: hypothetical protein ACJ78Q_16585 [Chloroflexia bacterium]